MSISVPLTELANLTGNQSLLGLEGSELQTALRAIFSFLPARTSIAVSGGQVQITLPPPPPSSEAEADRLAAKAGQRAAKGELAKAAGILKKVLELNPAHPTARRDLAMVCQQTGDFEAAKDHLIEVLRLNPSDAWALVILANHYLRQETDADTAERFLLRALELKPSDTWALNSMGTVMMARKKPREAIGFFDQAIRGNSDFANAYLGKATVLLELADAAEAATVLEEMFKTAKAQDARSGPVFQQAQTLYAKTEAELADEKADAAREAVLALESRAEELSGYPVKEISEELEAKVVAKMRMAWKHNTEHHTLVMRKDAEFPAAIRHHISAHELMHVIMESEARDVGTNRWFTTTPENRETAIRDVAKEIRALEKRGFTGQETAAVLQQLLAGANAFLFNCPLDMLIERRLRQEQPVLKEAQFGSVLMLARDGLAATMNKQIREIVPPTIQRINDTLNAVYALFVDDLFAGATSLAKHYRELPTFASAQRLFEQWKATAKQVEPGSEYDLVDMFAAHLGMTKWFTWRPDRGFLPPENLDLGTSEGVSNPELLQQKAPASVMYLLGALQKFDAMPESKVKEIAFEIAMRGREGIDYSDPDKKHTLTSLPGQELSGLQMMCLMYAGFKRFAPELDPGMDLQKEYEQALRLHERNQ